MIEVKNKVIDTPIYEILDTLLKELQLKGIDYLRVLRLNGNNIQVCCPYHNMGKEKRPSAGVLTHKTKDNQSGTFHCFACGETTSLPNLISHCFGRDDNGAYGEDWLLTNFNSLCAESRRDTLTSILDSTRKAIVGQIRGVFEQELEAYRYIHPYMYKRKLTDEVIEMFDVGYDIYTDCLTFPCNDEKGNCLFVTRRHTKTKFFHIPTGVEKPVYGLDKITSDMKEVVVCESIINALTLWTWGIPAVALLGTGTSSQYEILRNTSIRTYILAFDGDTAGYNATFRFIKNIRNKILYYYLLPQGKDINDLTIEEYKKLERRGI